MSWRDFFYFSKGERIGLIILLCLITTAGIILLLNTRPQANNEQAEQKSVIMNNNNNVSQSNTSNQAENKNENNINSSNNVQSNPNTTSNPNSRRTDDNQRATNSNTNENENRRESVSERVNRLTSYVRPSYTRIEKYEEGTIVELNVADTTILQKIPGIGSTFARRIVSYRNLLGGYYSVNQLSEVYGIDEDRFNDLKKWFIADPLQIQKININVISQDSLQRHPYINYAQARTIIQLRRQKGKLTGWENLQLLNDFTDTDRIKLEHYISFE
jgi:competence ComEA-like helix-hairpin-helix protein